MEGRNILLSNLMKCQADIEQLSRNKFADAVFLLQGERYDSAYYLAGYAIELLLKARVCKTLGIEDFFDFGNINKKRLKNEPTLTKPYKVHDFEQLLILSGIYPDFERTLRGPVFKGHWSVVSKWNEDSRYLSGGTKADTENFITSVRESIKWIQQHL